jgi:HAD superfamily hydrolase (TIGR01509 family)
MKPLSQTLLPEFKAVIFDMDGLVLDSEATYVHAWRQAAIAFGTELEDGFVHGLFGNHADTVERALVEKIGAGFDLERFRKLAGQCWREHVQIHGIKPMPGVDGLLALLDEKRIPYALATNSDGPYASECLRLAGLAERFGLVLTRDQVAAGKPEPDLFLEAARRMNVAAAECVVLEDSAPGLEAARRAGSTAALVLARPASPALQALAELQFNSLNAVAEAIHAQFAS